MNQSSDVNMHLPRVLCGNELMSGQEPMHARENSSRTLSHISNSHHVKKCVCVCDARDDLKGPDQVTSLDGKVNNKHTGVIKCNNAMELTLLSTLPSVSCALQFQPLFSSSRLASSPPRTWLAA